MGKYMNVRDWGCYFIGKEKIFLVKYSSKKSHRVMAFKINQKYAGTKLFPGYCGYCFYG